MASLARSTFTLAGRRIAPGSAYSPAAPASLASSFASSSRVRLDSTPSFRAEASSNAPPRSSAPSATPTLTPIVENPPTPSDPLAAAAAAAAAASLQPPTRPIPNLLAQRPSKAKYRVAPSYPTILGEDTTHTLTISSTRNNTVLTFADSTGPVFPTISAGTDKTFKNSQRSSYEAAHQAALKMFPKIADYVRTAKMGSRRMKVVFKGLRGGQGRDAVAAAISGQEGDSIRQAIGRVEDRTGIKIGGTRGKRVRRL